MRLRLLPLAIAVLSSSGCATAVSEPSVCPRVVEYPPAFQNRLADEIERLPVGSAIETALLDYQRERDVLRACRPETP